jgi:hypothetical protein
MRVTEMLYVPNTPGVGMGSESSHGHKYTPYK